MSKAVDRNALAIYLESYDIVLLVKGSLPDGSSMVQALCSSDALKSCGTKVCVFSTENVKNDNGDVSVTVLEEDDFLSLEKLYHTYEFSDRFRVLSEETSFGTILNFIRSGDLTKEEAFEAILI